MKKYLNKHNIWDILELSCTIGMLMVGFLQACSLTFGKIIISYFLWPTLILSFFVCCYKLIYIKKYKNDRLLILLLIFIFTYVISILLNFEYGYYENLRTLIWFIMLVFIVYLNNSFHRDNSNRLFIIILFYLIGVFVLNVLSFYTMLSGTWSFVLPEVSQTAPIYYLGFVWGRLYGVYWDANIGATMCVISIILSLEVIIKYKKKYLNIFSIISILLSFLYIVFSDSRTGLLGLGVGVFFWCFLYISRSRILFINILKAFFIMFLVVGANFGVENIFNYMQNQGITHIAVHTVEDNTFTNFDINHNLNQIPQEDNQSQNSTITNNNIGRKEEYKSDFSNRRFDIWRSAIEIFKTKPLFGITHNNVIDFAEENLPDTYIINNNHQKFQSMHNTFFDVLVSQGVIGEISYVLIVGTIVIDMFNNRRFILENTNKFCTPVAIFFSMMAISCVMTEIVYVTSPMATILWLYIRKLMEEIKNAKNS